MKKSIFMLLGAAALLSACQTKSGYMLSGKIEGVPSDTLIVCVPDLEKGGTERIDTIAMQNGVFAVNLQDTTPRMILITSKPQNGAPLFSDQLGHISTIVVPGEELTINGTLKEYQLGGNEFFTHFFAATAILEENSKAQEEILKKYQPLFRQEGINKDSLEKAFMAEREPLQQKLNEEIMQYIQANPDDEISAYLVASLGDKAEEGWALLSDKAKNSRMAFYYQSLKKMKENQALRKEAAKALEEGKPAPDFTLKDLNGNDFTLSSLRGQYVILDFWGSWCKWCIKGFPELKAAYAKHKGKVEVVGVDCSDTVEKWKQAVAENELPWINVYNPKKEDITFTTYAISAYPTKILIDKEGVIQKVCVGEDPAFYTYLDEVLK